MENSPAQKPYLEVLKIFAYGKYRDFLDRRKELPDLSTQVSWIGFDSMYEEAVFVYFSMNSRGRSGMSVGKPDICLSSFAVRTKFNFAITRYPCFSSPGADEITAIDDRRFSLGEEAHRLRDFAH